MKNLLLSAVLVSLPLLLGGCGEKGVNYDELEEREGIICLKGSDTPYTGKSFTLYENGQKRTEVNHKDGKLDGLTTSWPKNGQKAAESNWKDGEMLSEKYWNSKGESVDSEEEAFAE